MMHLNSSPSHPNKDLNNYFQDLVMNIIKEIYNKSN